MDKLPENESYFQEEFKTLNHFKGILNSGSDTKQLEKEFSDLTQKYESLLKQSVKLTKIGDSTQRRLIKVQNQLQEANDEIETAFNNLKSLVAFGQNLTSTLETREIIMSLHHHISKIMNTDVLAIGTYEERSKQIKYKFLVKDGEYVPSMLSERLSEDNLSSICFNEKNELLINDIDSEYPSYKEGVKELWDEYTASMVYFPLQVEDRFIGIFTVQSYKKNAFSERQMNILRSLASFIGIATDNSSAYRDLAKKNKMLNDNLEKINHLNSRLEEEMEKSEKLLLNILPESIAERLKKGENVISDFFPEATVLFADIAGFTKMSASLPSPAELVVMLNQIFSSFDNVADKYKLEKIKTIGDCYMLAGGIPVPSGDHTERTVSAALEMLDNFKELNSKWNVNINIRIGIHVGSVIAGVIGKNKFVYDLWGDTVNISSRMESHGVPGRINCSEIVYNLLKDKFSFEDRGEMEVKGKGIMRMHFINSIK